MNVNEASVDFVPITENEHIKAFLGLLQANNAKAPEITDIIKLFAAVESDLNRTISALQKDINEMREVADHPLKTAWQKAADGIMKQLRGLRAKLRTIKNKIAAACKHACEDFKDKGVVALNNAVEFIGIRRDLEQARDQTLNAIAYNKRQITKVETLSAEMHAASRHVKNIGRALTGKETIPDVKPNGKLAKLVEAPYRDDIKGLTRSLGRINRMITRLDGLEKSAQARAERERPSTVGFIKRLQIKVAERKRETPVKDAEKAASVGAEI